MAYIIMQQILDKEENFAQLNIGQLVLSLEVQALGQLQQGQRVQ